MTMTIAIAIAAAIAIVCVIWLAILGRKEPRVATAPHRKRPLLGPEAPAPPPFLEPTVIGERASPDDPEEIIPASELTDEDIDWTQLLEVNVPRVLAPAGPLAHVPPPAANDITVERFRRRTVEAEALAHDLEVELLEARRVIDMLTAELRRRPDPALEARGES